MPGRSRSGASMVCLRTLAMRRAMTWAARRSVSVNTAKIELSASRQAEERQQPLDDDRGLEGNALEIRHLLAEMRDHGRDTAQHHHRQIAEPHVLGQYGQQGFDDTWAEAVADRDPVDVAGIEDARRG